MICWVIEDCVRERLKTVEEYVVCRRKNAGRKVAGEV